MSYVARRHKSKIHRKLAKSEIQSQLIDDEIDKFENRIEYHRGSEYHYTDGQISFISLAVGGYETYQDGQLHSFNGYPALDHGGSRKEWYWHGLNHRIGAPAVISSQYEQWFVMGKLHREDGPAYVWVDHMGKEHSAFFLNGVQVDKLPNSH